MKIRYLIFSVIAWCCVLAANAGNWIDLPKWVDEDAQKWIISIACAVIGLKLWESGLRWWLVPLGVVIVIMNPLREIVRFGHRDWEPYLFCSLVLTFYISEFRNFISRRFVTDPIKVISILSSMTLFSCASPGVIQTGPNSYLISRMSAGGAFANRTKLKYDAIREANEFASQRGKMAEGIVAKETPAAPGQMPSIEYQFRLVDPNSSGDGRKSISSDSMRIETDR